MLKSMVIAMCSSLLIHVDFTYCLKTLVLKTQCLAKPWHVHHFEKLGFKVGPLLLGVYVCFQLRSKMAVLDARLKTSIFFITVENIRFQPKKKEEPIVKLSSMKLGICQAQNSIILAYQTPFPKPTMPNVCGLPFILLPFLHIEY